MFHLLQHDGDGGETQLVDGFAAALRLRTSDSAMYDTLKQQKMFFHASGNEGLSITSKKPVPVLETDGLRGAVTHVRWNNADRGALVTRSIGSAEPEYKHWYSAAR